MSGRLSSRSSWRRWNVRFGAPLLQWDAARCGVERIDGAAFGAADKVEVRQRGLDVTVAHEMLDGPDVDAAAEQARGEGVA